MDHLDSIVASNLDEMTEELWRYDQPHPSGGNCAVTMTRAQAIAWMRSQGRQGTDDEVFEDWATVNWAELARAQEEITVDDGLIADYRKVIALIPECPAHGDCLPHAQEWITAASQDSERLDYCAVAVSTIVDVGDGFTIRLVDEGLLQRLKGGEWFKGQTLRAAIDTAIAQGKEESSQ